MAPHGRWAVLSVALSLLSTAAFAKDKIDPLLSIMANTPEAAVSSMVSFGVSVQDGITTTEVIIKAAPDQAEEAGALVEDVGGTVGVVIEEIMTATIPINAITALDDSEFIEAVEAAKPVTNKMNAARGSTGSRAGEVQEGTCTGCKLGTGGYTGTDVIVGIVDTGIDCRHADFKNIFGITRIINYFDQTTNTDYTSAQLADGTCSGSPDTDGHGSHVAGIAAGSNATYTGVASTASIIAVKTTSTDANSSGTFSTKVLEAANYIFTKADAANKAAVVNLSLGTSLGAHDGTSLLEQGLDALLTSSGTEKKGKAIVDAAGNENIAADATYAVNFGGIHAPISVAAGTPKGFEVGIMSAEASTSVVDSGGGIIDFWLNSGTDCTVEAKGYKKADGSTFTTGAVSYGAAPATGTDDTAKVIVSYAETAASGKKHGVVTVNRASDSVASTILSDYFFLFILNGTCTGNAWLYPDQTGLIDFSKQQQVTPSGYTYAPGDSNMTITIPGTASKVITVASYMDRDTWVDINGVTQNQTNGTCGSFGTTNLNLSTFSSLGPTANTSDLQKPDIAAPGEPILSTLSSSVTTTDCRKGDATHYKQQGTSMASPHVAGTVALMFQKNKCLTPTEVKQYLRATATADTQTGFPLPTYAWGYGKLNAAAVMNQFQAKSACDSPAPTPSSGGSGCSLSGAGDGDAPSAALLVGGLVLCCLAIVLRRGLFVPHRSSQGIPSGVSR